MAALVLLFLSSDLAVYALLLPGAEQNGPSVAEMLDARASNDDETVEGSLLEALAAETFANERALARKDPSLAWAVALLVLAIVLGLAGVQ
jgi:hypothetical protein